MPSTINLFSNIRAMLLASLLVCMLLFSSGCVAVIAGAAAAGTGVGVAYYEGALRGSLIGDPMAVAAAGKAAMQELGIRVSSDHADVSGGEVVGQTVSGKKVTIAVKPEGQKISGVTIRVGFFGDEQISRQIFNKMEAQLGSPTAPPAGAKK